MRGDADQDDDDNDEDDEELEGTTASQPRSKVPIALILGIGLIVVLAGPLLAVLVFLLGGKEDKTAPKNGGGDFATPVAPSKPEGDFGITGPNAGPDAASGGASMKLPPAPSLGGVGGPLRALSVGDGPSPAAQGFRPPFDPTSVGSGQALFQWEAEAGNVIGLAMLAEDRQAVLGTTNAIRIIDLESRKEIRTFAEDLAQSAMAVSADGKRLLTGGGTVETKEGKRVPRDCVVRLWDLDQGKELRKLEGHTRPITTVAFSANGRWALSAGGGEDRGENNTKVPIDCGIRIWDLVTYRQLTQLEGHQGPVRCAAFVNYDQTCVTGSSDGTLRTWNLMTGQVQHILRADMPITSLACSPEGMHVYSGQTDGSVIQWNLHTGQAIKRFDSPPESKYVHWVGLTRDGTRLLSAHGWIDVKDGKTVPVDPTVRCWSLHGNGLPQKFSEHTQMVKAVAQAASGSWLITASQDRTLRLWRPAP